MPGLQDVGKIAPALDAALNDAGADVSDIAPNTCNTIPALITISLSDMQHDAFHPPVAIGCAAPNEVVFIATEFSGNTGQADQPFAYIWRWRHEAGVGAAIGLPAGAIDALVAPPGTTRMRRAHELRVVGQRLFVVTDLGPTVDGAPDATSAVRLRAYSTWDLDGNLVAVTPFAGLAPLSVFRSEPNSVHLGTLLGRDVNDGLLVVETVRESGSLKVHLLRLSSAGDLAPLATYSTQGTRVLAASSSDGRTLTTASAAVEDNVLPGIAPPSEIIVWDVEGAKELGRFSAGIEPQRIVGLGADKDAVWLATAYPHSLEYMRRGLDRVVTVRRLTTGGNLLWVKEIKNDFVNVVDWFPSATAQAMAGVLLPPLSLDGGTDVLRRLEPSGEISQLDEVFRGAWDWSVRVEPDVILGTSIGDPLLRLEVIRPPGGK